MIKLGSFPRITLILLAFHLCACEKKASSKEPAPKAVPGKKETSVNPLPINKKADSNEIIPKSWTSYRGDQEQSGVAAGRLPKKPTRLWVFETKKPLVSSPVIAAGKVFFGCNDKKVRALNQKTGKLIWEFETKGAVEAPPLYLDKTIYIGSKDYHLYALDAETGKEKWRFQTDDKVLGGANWIGEGDSRTIIFGCYDNFVYAVNAKDGKKKWSYETDNYVHGSPAITKNGRVLSAGCDGFLYVLDALSGKKIKEIEIGNHIATSVAVSGSEAYLGHYGNMFHRVNIETSKIEWTYKKRNFPYLCSPAITESLVVFGGRDRRVHCVDRGTGKEIWEFKSRGKIDASPIICGSELVVGSSDGKLYILNLGDGKARWTYEVGQPLLASPAVGDGMIVQGSEDGRLVAFGEGE